MARTKSIMGSKLGIVLGVTIIGIAASTLQWLGNPPNMGLCSACFTRDLSGALGLHRFEVCQYIRPELLGLIFGALLVSMVNKEWHSRGGSTPALKFIFGMFGILGAFTFIGCPWRACLRLAGGDLSAIAGIVGLVAGVAIGTWFIGRGFTLDKKKGEAKLGGLIMPVFALLSLGLLIYRVEFKEGGPVFFSLTGPGSMAAPIPWAMAIGLLIGIILQRTRFCTMAAIRNCLLMRDNGLLWGLAALVAGAALANLCLGQFHPGLQGMPNAHSNEPWSIIGMLLAGLCFTLGEGCPGRQFVLAGEGDTDATIFCFGMMGGAALATEWGLAAVPDQVMGNDVLLGGPPTVGKIAVLAGLVFCLISGFTIRRIKGQ